jgi:hypothetical protein
MRSLHQLCTPRASVFDKSRRDVVLDITDLAENRIDPDDFFADIEESARARPACVRGQCGGGGGALFGALHSPPQAYPKRRIAQMRGAQGGGGGGIVTSICGTKNLEVQVVARHFSKSVVLQNGPLVGYQELPAPEYDRQSHPLMLWSSGVTGGLSSGSAY